MRALGGVWRWTGGAVLLAVLLRLASVGVLAYPDEGGLLLVARQWHDGGPGIYGDLWVDRPPLLLVFWRVADLLGGVTAARLLGIVAVAVLVVVAAWAGQLVGGRRGSRWASLVAAALAASPLLGAREVGAELLGAPLVMIGCVGVLQAARPGAAPGAQALWAVLSGVAGTTALLVKQNLADGLVFALVLTAAAGLAGVWSRGRALRVLGFGILGASAPVLLTLGWAATTGAGVDGLAYTLYGFRMDAAEVVSAGHLSAPSGRLLLLAGAGVASGLAPLFAVYLWSARRSLLAREPITLALTAMLAYGLVSVVAGASYWPHYWLELVPAAALAAGLLAEPSAPRSWVRAALGLPLVASALAVAVLALPSVDLRSDEVRLAAWLEDAGRSGDTAVVTYGHANLLAEAGLRPSGYPYLWSLPQRTLDPALTELAAELSGPTPPTWIVEWNSFGSWDLDRGGRLERVIDESYRSVGRVCGVAVYLHESQRRRLPPVPSTC